MLQQEPPIGFYFPIQFKYSLNLHPYYVSGKKKKDSFLWQLDANELFKHITFPISRSVFVHSIKL